MEHRKHKIDLIFIVTLAGIFFICSITFIVLGANLYANTVSSTQDSFQIRTASLYFTQKIRQNGKPDSVQLTSMKDGSQALVLKNGDYETWIFLADGQLKEATVKQGTTVTESFGQPVLSLRSLKFEPRKSNLLRVTAVSPEGTVSQVDLLLRTSQLEVRP